MSFAATALLLSLPSLLGAGRPSSDLAFMRQALAEARKAADQGEVPVGAVLVAGDGHTVIARTHNLVARRNDPTAHAELLAAQQDVDGASELLSDPSSEPELVELAREELAEGERVLVERRKRLISLLVPPDETSAQEGVIIEEHAGVGEP